MHYVGIDISKETFDVAIEDNGQYRHQQFSNDLLGFKDLITLLDKQTHWCVMEASGPYYLKLATYLQNHEITLSVVNPLQIRLFCKMRLKRAKTDKKDAVMIAKYAKSEQPKAWQAEAAHVLELRQMLSYADQLNKQRSGLHNQMEALKRQPHICEIVFHNLEFNLTYIDQQIDLMDQQMKILIEQHYATLYNLVKSVPGIGNKTAIMLIVISRGFTKFNHVKQLSSYVGLSPRIFESGTSVKGKVKICKMGMSGVRKLLYLCTWSAIKHNPACKALYERLVANGKAKMVALIAVANKLLKQVFAVTRKGEIFDKNFSTKACF